MAARRRLQARGDASSPPLRAPIRRCAFYLPLQAWLEGGPRLAAAFLRAGMVDEVRWYIAPALLGNGVPAIADLGIGTIDDIRRFRVVQSTTVGNDVRLDLQPEE